MGYDFGRIRKRWSFCPDFQMKIRRIWLIFEGNGLDIWDEEVEARLGCYFGW